TVIEGGVGAGAFTLALLRAVGPQGRVISYEIREDMANAARRNVRDFHGDAPNWELKVRDLYEGCEETGVDRLFLDLPEPERALGVVARALRPGGVLVCYVPTAVQLKQTVDAIQADAGFGQVESFETLLRHWQVKGLSVRPLHRMVAHSAFIIVARRLADQMREAFAADALVEDDSVTDTGDTESNE
ncbi:MAG: tRNA (adenine-N1)-methyltransferase, partial [Candidatus Binataceae bacterium]